MSKTETIRARIDPSIKHDTEVRLPNGTTLKAMQDALAGEALSEWTDLGALGMSHRARLAADLVRLLSGQIPVEGVSDA
ncbi:MAG: hypothetical protein HQL58_13205 [Magnetococcales bacterium]|nr:hypothetical protein [Magnetococcales bacterium]